MLTRDLAVELRGTGITVNGIAPGAVQTQINRDLLRQPNKMRALLAQIPAGRLGRPEEVAALAAFLASPKPTTRPAPPTSSTAASPSTTRSSERAFDYG